MPLRGPVAYSLCVTGAQPSTARRIHAIAGWRRALLWPLGLLVRLWCRTLRIEIDERSRAVMGRTESAAISTLWPTRLFIPADL